MRRALLFAGLFSCLVSAAPGAQVVNGSFEPATAGFERRPADGGSADVPGWSASGSGVEWISGAAHGFAAPSGAYVVDLATGVRGAGGIRQAFATEPGRTYRVAFWLGSEAAAGADGTARIVASAAGRRETFTIHNRAPEVLWQAQAFRFRARAERTTLEFRCAQDARRHFAFLDGVAVTPSEAHEYRANPPAPEPSGGRER